MLEPGKYRHFKGNMYEVICVARHSETEEPMAVYKSEKDGSIWVRPLEMFIEPIEKDGLKQPRFTFIE